MHQGNPDQGCAIATTLPPHHSSYARHPSSCCTNSSSSHGSWPYFWNPNSDHPGSTKLPGITPPQHPLTQTPRLTNSRGTSFQTSTFNPEMLHRFLTLCHKTLILEFSNSHRMINLLLRIESRNSFEFKTVWPTREMNPAENQSHCNFEMLPV